MTRKSRINYLKAISHNVERKKMYKAKKQWIVAGMSFLVATGLGAIGSHLTTHADANNSNNQQTTSVALKSASGSASNVNNQKSTINSASVMQQARLAHKQLLGNRLNTSQSSNVQSTKSSSAQSSNINGSKPATNSGETTPSGIGVKQSDLGSYDARQLQSNEKQKEAYANYLKNNPKLVSLYANTNPSNSNATIQFSSNNLAKSNTASNKSKDNVNASNINSNSSTNKIGNSRNRPIIKISLGGAQQGQSQYSDGHWIYNNGKYINSNSINDWQNGTNYYGLNYRYSPSTQSLEFTGGTLTWNGFSFDTAFIGYDNITNHNRAPKYITAQNLQSIKFDSDVDISKVFNMAYMFFGDNALQSLDVSHFDTSKVTDMSGMFANDDALQNLDVSHFDTSNVTDMYQMFEYDSALQTLNLGNNFNTGNVNNMGFMFDGDSALQTLNLGSSHFNTSNVNNMVDMFESDYKLIWTLPKTFNTEDLTHENIIGSDNLSLPSGIKFSSLAKPSFMYKKTGNTVSDSLTNLADGKSHAGEWITPHKYDVLDKQEISSDFISSNEHRFTYVDSNGNPVSSPDNISKGELVALQDDGLLYKKNNDGIEFYGGTPNSDLSKFSNNSDVQNAKSITFDSDINTTNVKNMNGMFSNTTKLQSIIINSSNTQFSKDSGIGSYYKKVDNNNDTAPTSNDFSQVKVGTFLSTQKIPTDTINYQLNGNTVASQKFTATSKDYNGNSYNNLDVTSSNDTKIPSGYKLVNSNNSFNYDSGTYSVPITVNSVTTNGTFNYTNQKGSNVNQYTPNRAISISGTPNVSQNVESQANNERPNGYSLKSSNPIEMNNDQQYQTLNVSVVGNNISNIPIVITSKKYDNSKYINSNTHTITKSGITGDSFTIRPSDSEFTPAGYKTSSNPVSDIFTPNGVQTSSYTFNYNAQQGTPININYINQNRQNVGSGQIAGHVDDTGNVTQKVAVPSNYNLNGGQSSDYHITTNPQTINLNVTGKPATVKFDFNNQHGQYVGSDTVNAEVGDTVQPNSYPKGYAPKSIPSFTIHNAGQNNAPTATVQGKSASQDNGSNNYTPKSDRNDIGNNTAKGYATVEIVKYSSNQLVSDSFKTYDENDVDVGDTYTIVPPSIANYTANANQQLTGTVKSDGSLSNGYAKFTYNANPDSNKINIQYKNQDGNVVATGSVGGTYDEKGTINSLPTTNNINNNYTLNNNVDYQINHTQSPLVVRVTGKSANATINFVNQNNQPVGHTTVNGKTGDTVSPSSNKYPQGYQPNPSPSYNFTHAGNNTAITAHVKGQSASALNGSNNYTPKSDADDVNNNAKHGYATVETVKLSSGQLISDSYKTFNENNVQVGNSFTLTPQTIPNYTTTNGPTSIAVNSNGSLSNNGFAKFVYNANRDNNPIHIKYINQDNTSIYSDNIYGTYDEKGTISDLPNANDTNTNYILNHNVLYQFEADSNPLNVSITGKPANATINFINQSGDKAGSEPVNGKAGDTVSPSQYPSGYMKPNPATTYHFNTAGTNPDMDNVVLHGATASDLNGSKEYNPYTPTSDGSNTDPTTDTNNPLNPNSSKNNNDDKYNADHGYATINVVQYINDKIVKESAHIINENPNHSVGDHYSIDPDSNSLLPYGYKPATTTTSLNGTIQPNGSLSNGYATFRYVVNPSMIKPIQATFYNQDGATINVHTGDDSSTNDTEYISSNDLATLGPVGTSVNIMKFLTAPYGYHFIANEVPNVTLQQKSHGFGMMLLNVLMPSKQDLANMAIRNDSAETSNDLNITQNFLNQSTISGSVKSDINNDIEIINNESADINNDINGGYASETNANNAFDNANLAYGFAYSEYASATSSYASSVASANANNIASGSAQTASTIASKAASGSASTALTKAINEAHDKENKLQQAINNTKAALQKSQNDSSQDNTSNQKEIAALRTKISKLQKTLANTKKRDAKILATVKASAANSSSYANSMANSAENNLEQQLVNTKLELQEDQAKGQSTIQGNQNEITALKTKITKLQRTLANTKKHDSNSLASAEAQDTSVASYAISMANSKESNLEKQLTNTEKELHADQSSSQSTIKNNQSEITELNTKIADIQKDLTNTKQQDAINQASEATKDASASSLANSEASSNENSLEQQLSNAESELKVSKSNSQSTMNNTQSEIAQLRTKINDLQQALTNEKAKITNTSTSVSASEAQSSASSALSSSTSQINSDVSLAKDWNSNSAISDITRKSISNDINTMNTDISEINQYIGKGSNGSVSAAKYLTSASSAYSAASSLASSAINSYNSSVSASALSSLIANTVNNANKSVSSGSVSLTSDDIQNLAKDINIQPATNTVNDSSALNNLTREVATNNSEIGSLANKPNSAESINYGYFDNLVNNGVNRLTNAINNDFKANVHHVHVQPAKPRKTVGKRAHTYLKWLRIVKPLKLYNNKHQVVRILRPKHMITLNVKAVSKIHNQLVFKVSYRSHSYFIKANSKVVKNAYLPVTKRLVGRKVRVLATIYAYHHKASDKAKALHKNYVGRIKNIVRIGNHNVTRIQLSNNLWISANMNYVKVL